MSSENFQSRLESLLEREFELGHRRVRVTGVSSSNPLAAILSNASTGELSSAPHLVVVPEIADAQKFAQNLSFWGNKSSALVLPPFDVSPYMGLEPSAKVAPARLRFLHAAQNARPGQVFVAPVGGLLQKTLPYKVLAENTLALRIGQDLPKNPADWFRRRGYRAAPLVEDVGQYSIRGGIIDFFSPAHEQPVRMELFGDTIESLRHFHLEDQRSHEPIPFAFLIPCEEVLWNDDSLEALLADFRSSVAGRDVDSSELEEALRSLSRQTPISGIEYLLPLFYEKLSSPLDHFNISPHIWLVDPIEITHQADLFLSELKSDFQTSTRQLIRPEVGRLYSTIESLTWPQDSTTVEFAAIDTEGPATSSFSKILYPVSPPLDLSHLLLSQAPGSDGWLKAVEQKFSAWKKNDFKIFISVRSRSQAERLRLLLEKIDWTVQIEDSQSVRWADWIHEQDLNPRQVHIVARYLPESLRLTEEGLIFIRDEDLLGKKQRSRETRAAAEEFQNQAKLLNFGDLKPGDFVVHLQHGIGVYEGLKRMSVGGADGEFIQVAYKDKDRLYLPVYRVGQLQKYSGASSSITLDKLGGSAWEKAKTKVRSHLRDIASELLQLYAKRAEAHRPPFVFHEDDFAAFEAAFPYDETDDQLRAIGDLVKDMTSTKPMDRLICGDVGFGKTEVAMRAAFIASHNRRQVAVLAPTTVLTFQHYETFKKRFQGWPFEIRELNRFVSAADVKKTLKDLKEGRVDIIIGTHRLLSKDVEFKDLGFLVVDEEQKFGVAHKERIRKLKTSVDTLAMSATPIPRTLNMSLVGIRDLSIINTAPVDRLPTRTFILKWDEETIRKAITSEISRGGQVYFIHNRIQSIYALADEVKKIVPQARIKIGHGQMDEDLLEKTMVEFFHHEIDVLICTTIVESGMDIPKANTMFIDQAHIMGLSQLYQLRGRVGRSKQRAYCYLMLPHEKKLMKEAQERLKVIQENTELGSGIRIAQYDLELRGTGDLLGEEQSGHANVVGYELYFDLLNEAIHQLRGEPIEDAALEPDINLRIPALIPDTYVQDIRLRLSYYKAMTDIRTPEDAEKMEAELRDQFGQIPEPTLNLLGLMLIRSQCRELGVRDVSAGLKNISLIFTEKTKMKPETVIGLAMKDNKKFSITPDNRLNIRMNNISWPAIYEELQYLQRFLS